MPDTAVLGWARRHPRHGRFYGLANVAARPAAVPRAALGWAGLVEPVLLLEPDGFVVEQDQLVLPPLGLAWYRDAADSEVLPRYQA